MKKRLLIGLLGMSVIAVMALMFEKEVDAVTCAATYTHKTYTVYGVEKHSCVKSTTGSGIFDWGFWGISKKSLKGGLGLRVQYFGTVDSNGNACTPVFDPITGELVSSDCLISGLAFCCNGGGQCGGQGKPFRSETLSAQSVLQPADCDSTGKCRDVITLDINDEQLLCQNRNWGGTFTPFAMYVQSCTCDTGFVDLSDPSGGCNGTAIPSCDVDLCTVDLTGYQPGDHRAYTCTSVVGDSH